MTSQLLYIIHAADDKALAGYLKSQVEAQVPGMRAFVASKAGQIPTGSEWLQEIQSNLKAATAFLLLLTPRSVTRFWVWYEAGAAWMSDRPRFPVAAAGLDRSHISLPLSASQTLALDEPGEAAQLFVDLGGKLEDPDEFCRVVRAVSLPLPTSGPDEKRIRQIREAFGQSGEPLKLLLRTMLRDGGLSFAQMRDELKEHRYASDGLSIERMRKALKDFDLIEGDEEGRWRVKDDAKETLERCFNPSLSKRMMNLAERMRHWVQGDDGLIDLNAFQRDFQAELNALREKAERDHAEADDMLSKFPSSAGGVRGIADALERVAKRLPN